MAASLHDFETKNPPLYSRKEKSLGVLCSNFLKLYNRDGIDSIGLDKAANQLGVERRRIYDIVNILESVGVLTRKAKNQYTWKGFGAIPHALEELRRQASNENSRITKFCNSETVSNESGGLSNSDNSNTDRHAKPSASSKESNRKEKSLGLLTQNFIKLFISSDADLISLDSAATALLGDVHDPTAMRTKVRRLYDIANVFQSMDLIEKMRHPENGKPAFRWLGVKGDSKTKPHTMDTNSSRRVFGTDITNRGSKRHQGDSLWSSKENRIRPMHMNTVLVKDEYDENLMNLQPQHSSKDFVFGPFTPITAHEAGTSGNKKVRQTQDWEILADTYRPQYRNQALSDLSGHYAKALKSWYVEVAEK